MHFIMNEISRLISVLQAVDPAPVRAPAPIDYPHLDLRAPPPAAATRPGHGYSPSLPSLPASALPSHTHPHASQPPQLNGHASLKGPPEAPLLPALHTVSYWDSSEIGMSGLKNMGNTCYMNATVQCLSATAPFAAFFRCVHSLYCVMRVMMLIELEWVQ